MPPLNPEWTEWHLTPRGWERGSERRDFAMPLDRDRPTDAVRSVRYTEHPEEVYGGLRTSQEETWTCGDQKRIDALHAQFGQCPTCL